MKSRFLTTPQEERQGNLWPFLLLMLVIIRLFVLVAVVEYTDLAGDEAYYWDWGRRLDWGYYSKPPMIGWLMGLLGGVVGGGTPGEFAIRGVALLLGTLTLVVFHQLARCLYDARTALLAVMLVLLTPANTVRNLSLTIDTPLLLTWTVALLLFWRAVERPDSWGRWLLLGVMIGLGALTKQMMLVFPLIMLVFAALSWQDRHLLKNPRLYISFFIGLVMITPTMWWNQQHRWVMLEHTLQHFDTKPLSLGGWIVQTVTYPAGQALLYTPVTWIALISVLWFGMTNWLRVQRRERFLLLFSAPPLAVFALLALWQRINPNWPEVFYVSAFILAAGWMNHHLPIAPTAAWKRWALGIAGAFMLIIHLGLVAVFATNLKGLKKFEALLGWSEVGKQAGTFLDHVPRSDQTFVLALDHRYLASQMAFYMPQHPRVYRWEPSGVPKSQYEVWPGAEERLSQDGLILSPAGVDPSALPAGVASCFESVEALGRIEVVAGPQAHIYDVFLGRKLLKWKAVGARITDP